MLDALHQIALEQVVGTHADLDQTAEQFLQHLGIVVDAPQQDRLVPHRDARVRQPRAGRLRVRREFHRMVEVRVDEDRVVLAQHRHEFGRDAHRQHHRRPRSHADDVDGGHGAHGADHFFQRRRRHGEGIAPRDHDVPYLAMDRKVVRHLRQMRRGDATLLLPGHALACAVPAVGRARRGRDQQRAVRIAVHEARHDRILLFSEGIIHESRTRVQFLALGNTLPEDGVAVVQPADQPAVVRGNRQRERRGGVSHAGSHGEVWEPLAQLIKRADSISDLPSPVIPLGICVQARSCS